MRYSWSADVPEFWLHHTFLDKVWYLYQQRGEEFKNAYKNRKRKKCFYGLTHKIK